MRLVGNQKKVVSSDEEEEEIEETMQFAVLSNKDHSRLDRIRNDTDYSADSTDSRVSKVSTPVYKDDEDGIEYSDDEDEDGIEYSDDEDDLDETLYEDSWSNPMEIYEGVEVSGDLQYHLDNKISLGEGLFRYGSDSYVKLYTEVKILKDLNVIKLNENDEELIKDFTNQSVIIEGERILLNLIVEDNGSSILEEGDKKK